MADFAAAVKVVIDHEQIKQVILVGHCFGGMVGLEFAYNYPNYCQKLLLFNSSSYAPSWMMYLKPVLPLLKLLAIQPCYEHVDTKQFVDTNDFDLKRLYSDVGHVGMASYYTMIKTITNWNMTPALSNIVCKVVVIGGSDDHIYPWQRQLKLAHQITKATLFKIKGNHILPINNQTEVLHLIKRQALV